MDELLDISKRLSGIVSALDNLPSQVTKIMSQELRRKRESVVETSRDRADVRADEYMELKRTAGKALMELLQAAHSIFLSSHKSVRLHGSCHKDRSVPAGVVGWKTQGTNQTNIQDTDER